MNKKLQVFVSSTYTDLIEERQAAVQAILDAGHIPAGMELFKAGNESQLQTIYKWIDDSDVYMLILGGRYGSIEPKSEKSYTQLEYEYALSKNIPVFAAVLSDSFLTQKITSLGLKNATEQISPNKYQTFKSLVMSKIIREVDDCKDIKIIVYSTLNEFINEYDLVGWSRNHIKEKSTILLNENNLLKIQIQELQNKLNNIQEENRNIPYNTLLTILRLINFDYNNTKISSLNFFIKAYEEHFSECWYSIYDREPYIFSFLQEMNLVKKINHTDPSRALVRFNLTQYGIDFYKKFCAKILHPSTL